MKQPDSYLQELTCLGYYKVKHNKINIFTNGTELFTFIDHDQGMSKLFVKQLCGRGNRFKPFNNDIEKEAWYKKYLIVKAKIDNVQLFYQKGFIMTFYKESHKPRKIQLEKLSGIMKGILVYRTETKEMYRLMDKYPELAYMGAQG